MSAAGDYLTDEWGNPISEGEPAPVVAAPGTPSVFSVDYYRNKVTEFQNVLLEMDAAAAIGDDRIQRMSGRGVHPEKFTHGSSAQRVEWFRRGLESGSLGACDTFGTR